MTPELYACVDNATMAERSGMLGEALEWHQAVPMFVRGRHRAMLAKLVALGEPLPEWVWARWIVYLAGRCEDGATGVLFRQTVQDVVNVLHEDMIAACYLDGGDPLQVAARVVGESWLYRQTVVDSMLAIFIQEHLAGALAEHAGLVRRWAETPMGAYRLGTGSSGARLSVHLAHPIAGAEDIEVLDLGARARSCAGQGGWVLGRLVPSGIDELPMFDMPPLPVDECLARDVAAADGDWWGPVVLARQSGTLAAEQVLCEDYELTTDVQELDLLRFGTPPRDLARVMQQLRDGRDEIRGAAYRILDRAVGGTIDPDDHAFVAAAVQNEAAFDAARRRLTHRPGAAEQWESWARSVPEPSRRRLHALAVAAGSG